MERVTENTIPCFGIRKKYPCFAKGIKPRIDCDYIFCSKIEECEYAKDESRMCPYFRLIDKLYAYEETGLEPKEIIQMKNKVNGEKE